MIYVVQWLIDNLKFLAHLNRISVGLWSGDVSREIIPLYESRYGEVDD